jgi:hypothetical protein
MRLQDDGEDEVEEDTDSDLSETEYNEEAILESMRAPAVLQTQQHIHWQEGKATVAKLEQLSQQFARNDRAYPVQSLHMRTSQLGTHGLRTLCGLLMGNGASAPARATSATNAPVTGTSAAKRAGLSLPGVRFGDLDSAVAASPESHMDESYVDTIRTLDVYKCELQTLDLSHCKLVDATPLARAFVAGALRDLRTLGLAWNELGSSNTGVSDLLDALNIESWSYRTKNRSRMESAMNKSGGLRPDTNLISHSSLTELDLSWNSFGKPAFAVGAAGAGAGAGAGSNAGVKATPSVTAAAAAAGAGAAAATSGRESSSIAPCLGKFLAENLFLVHVDLSWNEFHRSECEVLAAGFAKNHSVLGMHIAGNDGAYVNARGFIEVRLRFHIP